MIEEQFVSFETAKLLKEAGFDVPCRGIYRAYRMGNSVFREYDRKNTKDDLCWNTKDGFQYEYLAPTQALAARWLREVHRIFIQLTPTLDGWLIDLFDLKKHQYIWCNQDTDSDSYETAFEAGLQEAVKLINNNGESKENME